MYDARIRQQQLTAETGKSVVAEMLYFVSFFLFYFNHFPCYTFMNKYDY